MSNFDEKTWLRSHHVQTTSKSIFVPSAILANNNAFLAVLQGLGYPLEAVSIEDDHTVFSDGSILPVVENFSDAFLDSSTSENWDTKVEGDFFSGSINFELVCSQAALISKGLISIEHMFLFPQTGKIFLQFLTKSKDLDIDCSGDFIVRENIFFCLWDSSLVLSLDAEDLEKLKSIYRLPWRSTSKSRTFQDKIKCMGRPTSIERTYTSLAVFYKYLIEKYGSLDTVLIKTQAKIIE